MKTIDRAQPYTFSKFFDLKIRTKDLAEFFNYTFERKKLNLPQYADELDRAQATQERIEQILPYVDLSNDTARREILIAPIVCDVACHRQAQIRIQYFLKVTEQLQGQLDHLLRTSRIILITEAKNSDMDFGMTQLCAELIALDQWENTLREQTHLLGAVTTGKIWEFAQVDRAKKHIEQGLESYRVPEDIEPLMRILVQALMS